MLSWNHYVFLTLPCLHPPYRTLGIYLEHDASHINYLCHGVPSSLCTLSAGRPTHQYWSLNIENGARINVRRSPTLHLSKTQSIQLQEQICSRIMGWSTFIVWQSQVKVINFKTICWTQFQPHSVSVVEADILSAVYLQFIISSKWHAPLLRM